MDFRACMESAPAVLMEGALGERLKREYHLKIDGPVAMADLVCSEAGKGALMALWKEYRSIAENNHLPFLATTPTRRANRERVQSAGYDPSIIRENVDFLRLLKDAAQTEVFVGGLMGCKGDAYTGEGALSTEEARAFHFWQADLFRQAGADFLYAGIMPALAEALGMAMAMGETGLPYIISFTVERNGRLIDGHTIDEAIRAIDQNTKSKPVLYMTNCVHPNIVYEALSQEFNRTRTVRERFIGIQANTSPLAYAELDASADLKSSAPEDLAQGMLRLKEAFGFRVFGGCCGTDGRHMREIARRL